MIEAEVDPRFDPEFLAFAYLGLAHFVGMRWVEWTAGGRVPDEIVDQVMLLLAKALTPGPPRTSGSAQADAIRERRHS